MPQGIKKRPTGISLWVVSLWIESPYNMTQALTPSVVVSAVSTVTMT